MAEELEVWPEAPYRKYPWKQWTNGRPWKVTQGEDFKVPLETFRASLQVRARSLGLGVRTHKEDAYTLVFQFYTKSEPQENP